MNATAPDAMVMGEKGRLAQSGPLISPEVAPRDIDQVHSGQKAAFREN